MLGYSYLLTTVNEEASICVLRDAVLITGPHCTLNWHYKASFGPTFQPNPPVKFCFDVNINFRMLEMNQPDFNPSAFLAHLSSYEDARLHPCQVDSKN